MEIPLRARRDSGRSPLGKIAHLRLEKKVLGLARARAARRAPWEIAVDLAGSIAAARAGGKEKLFGRIVPGLSRLDPALAGPVYTALLDPKGRKDLGAFYTPPKLARRMVRLALAGRQEAFVIDPACGSGAFLLEAARFLEERLGSPESAAARLFGIDRDEGALKVCHTVLAAHGYELPEQNLVEADALLESWPKPPGAPGFDAVIGNPPYRNIVRLPEYERSALRRRYATFRNKCDLYALFIEAAARHLLPGGRFALLVSDSFLGTSSFAPLRRLLFGGEAVRTRIVEQIAGAAFKDASVKVVALIGERSMSAQEILLVPQADAKSSAQLLLAPRPAEDPGRVSGRQRTARFSRITPEGRLLSSVRVGMEDLRLQCETSAAIPADPRAMELARAMKTSSVPLGELADIVLGIKTGDDARFVVEAKKGPVEEHFVPCIRGREISPWLVNGPGAWLDYRPDVIREVHGARPRRREHFDRPEKLLVRETSGTRLIAAYDDRRLFPLDTLHALLEREGSPASLWYLLAILNSSPASFWYGLHHPGPHVKASELRALPVPPPRTDVPEDSADAVAGIMDWIASASSDCCEDVSDESNTQVSSRSPPKAMDEILRDHAYRSPMLEALARLLSGEPDAGRRETAQSLIDQLAADAYGIGPTSEERAGGRP